VKRRGKEVSRKRKDRKGKAKDMKETQRVQLSNFKNI
jgi:hypothetical protein